MTPIDRSQTTFYDHFPINPDKPTVERDIGIAIVYDPEHDAYLGMKRHADGVQNFPGGGIEEGENPVVAMQREILEETGYKHLRFITELTPYRTHYRHATKDANYLTRDRAFVFELIDHEQDPVDPAEMAKHQPQRVKAKNLTDFLSTGGVVPMYDHLALWDEWRGMQDSMVATIDTDRLVLSAISHDDCDDIFRYFTVKVTHYMYPQYTGDPKDTQSFVTGAIRKNLLGAEWQYVVRTHDGGFVGCVGLHHVDTSTPEFGVWIREDYHGQGYGREMSQALIDHADKVLNYDYIYYPVATENTASRGLVESLGGVLISDDTTRKTADGREFFEANYRIYPPKTREDKNVKSSVS